MTPDCLILGGGLAGSMAALRLAASGRKTLLIEKEKSAHHKVCGEFLSPEAVSYLHQAGIDPIELGAVPIQLLRLSAGRRMVETRLPFKALSLSRHILDEALLSRAAEEGCTVRRGVAVDKLTGPGQDWTVHLSTGESVSAPAVFLATGKHDLRGWPRSKGVQSDLVGFKLHWRLAPPQTAALRSAMDLFLFRGGYGGLALVENEIANLCLVVRKPVLRKLGGWPALLTAILAENRRLRHLLGNAQPLWDRPLAVSSIPYGRLGSQFSSPSLWPLGDQFAVIPSFTGDGMSIALHSAALAAAAHLAGATAPDYQRQLVGQLRCGMSLATALSRAIVHPLSRRAAPLALSLFPQFLSWIASATRIPGVPEVPRAQGVPRPNSVRAGDHVPSPPTLPVEN
jgi:flavin-dependent dehydrogenase